MKAKIIKTGEIVDIYHEPQHGQVSNIYKESVFVNGRLWQENELEFIEPKEVDLEKEIYDAEKRFGDIDEMGGYRILIFDDDFRDVLRHFFELGLKAQKGE